MAAHFDTILRDSDFWTPEQYVQADEFPGTERVAFSEPVSVPNIHHLRWEDRVWRPDDYAKLPTKTCHSPGYTLLDGVGLASPGMALAADGRFIADAFTRLNPKRLSESLERDLLSGPRGRAAWSAADESLDKGILIAGPGLMRFGHFLLDFLPGLAMLDQHELFTDWPLLLPANAPDWVPAMIDVFSPKPRRIVARSRKIIRFSSRQQLTSRVGSVCVPWVVRQPAFHPSVAAIFRRIAEGAAAGDRGRRCESRVCIFRGKGDEKRRLLNTEDVESLFEARGFLKVQPERLSFLDQVRLFAGAQITVGEAGSGLHGSVFAKPQTRTLELRPETYDVHGQSAIAVLMGHWFTSVKGEQAVAQRMSHAPWTLDVDAVEQRLDELQAA